MNNSLKDWLIGLMEVAHPTPEKQAEILRGWEEYFRRLDIPVQRHWREFEAIMKIRIMAGSLSVVAPDVNALAKEAREAVESVKNEG